MYKIYYFSDRSGESEFVVISDQPKLQVVEDHGDGHQLQEVLDIDGDATSMPCDRRLKRV